MTIFNGGTLGAELESELLERSSSPSDSGGAGVVVFEFVEPDALEGFGLLPLVVDELGLFLSAFEALEFWLFLPETVLEPCLPDLAHLFDKRQRYVTVNNTDDDKDNNNLSRFNRNSKPRLPCHWLCCSCRPPVFR